MEKLGSTQFRIKSEHTNGPIGNRYVVQSESDGAEFVADVVVAQDDRLLAAVCENALRTKQWTDDPSVANVLEAAWLADRRYFQVLQMSPAAIPFDGGGHIAESQLRVVANSLVKGLWHLHRRELVHGTLSPACVYQEAGGVRLAELWFAHNIDGDPLYAGLTEFYPAMASELSLQFMSPEVLLGYPPKCASDIFSLGAVLFYFLTGEAPRGLPALYPQGGMLDFLAEAPIKSLSRLRPDLAAEIGGIVLSMLALDPGERPSTFLLKDLWEGLDQNFSPGDEELEGSLR